MRQNMAHLLMVVGLLATLFLIVSAYITLARFDNVALPLVVAGLGHAEIRRRVQAALDKVGLDTDD